MLSRLFLTLFVTIVMSMGTLPHAATAQTPRATPSASAREDALRLESLERRVRELEERLREERRAAREELTRFEEKAGQRLDKFESSVSGMVEKEMERTKNWVEHANKRVELFFYVTSALGAILAAISVVISFISFNASKLAKKDRDETKSIKKDAMEKLKAINTAFEHAETQLEEIKKVHGEMASMKVVAAKPDEKLDPAMERAAKTAAAQDADPYAKHVAEALLAQEKKDWETALHAWKAASEIDPTSAQPYFGMGVAQLKLAEGADSSDMKRKLLKEACKSNKQALERDANIHEAFNNWGSALANLAKPDLTQDGEERRSLLREAFQKYEQAIRIKPDYHEAFCNWGSALFILANPDLTQDGEERRSLLREAFQKYEQAIRIKPDKHEAFYNWGVALANLAKPDLTQDVEERRSLLLEAFQKYEQAIHIKPDMHEAFNNWGNALADLAKPDLTQDGVERRSLLRDAIKKYEQAIRIKPDKHEAFYNWGNALANLAKPDLTQDVEERRSLLREAFQKYEQAIRIKPDYHEAFYNWGNALVDLAKPDLTPDPDQRKRLLDEAATKCLEARRLKPKTGAYNLACVNAQLGRFDECRTWLEQSRWDKVIPSCAHIKADTDLDPVRDEPWFKAFLAEICAEKENAV